MLLDGAQRKHDHRLRIAGEPSGFFVGAFAESSRIISRPSLRRSLGPRRHAVHADPDAAMIARGRPRKVRGSMLCFKTRPHSPWSKLALEGPVEDGGKQGIELSGSLDLKASYRVNLGLQRFQFEDDLALTRNGWKRY